MIMVCEKNKIKLTVHGNLVMSVCVIKIYIIY